MDAKGRALLDAALSVMVDRAGGSVELTQTEFAGIKARRGPYQLVASVDRSGPGEPIIRVELRPSDRMDDTPIS